MFILFLYNRSCEKQLKPEPDLQPHRPKALSVASWRPEEAKQPSVRSSWSWFELVTKKARSWYDPKNRAWELMSRRGCRQRRWSLNFHFPLGFQHFKHILNCYLNAVAPDLLRNVGFEINIQLHPTRGRASLKKISQQSDISIDNKNNVIPAES